MGSKMAGTPPSLEQRVLALEQQLAALVGTNLKGKLSTRFVGVLTAITTGLGYVLSAQVLSDKESAIVALIVGGLTAFLGAEET